MAAGRTATAEFIGASNPPGDAVITCYLKKRHIFGDMKLQVLDSAGRLVQTLPTGKRRGLQSRCATGLCEMGALPHIPPAATRGVRRRPA